jgi:hypothetical protein
MWILGDYMNPLKKVKLSKSLFESGAKLPKIKESKYHRLDAITRKIHPKWEEFSRIFQKHNNCSEVIICLAFLFLAIMYDVLIRTTHIPYLHVGPDYIVCMFSALYTVAALGNAILSIIVSAFSNKVLGFTVKEILVMSSCKISIIYTIIKSFIVIIIAIPFFALGFCTTVTVLAIYVVRLISKTSISTWNLLTDDDFGKTIIEAEIESRGKNDPERFIMRWFPELNDSFLSNNEVQQDLYIDWLKKIVRVGIDSKRVTSATLEKRICDTFNLASFRLGFVDACKKVIYFNDWKSNPIFDSDKIAFSLINRIQYCTVNEIDAYRISETIDDIIERMEVEEYKKVRFAYGYYRSIKANEIIPKKTREDILNSIIEKLSYLRDTPTGPIRSRILLLIVKYSVLENEDIVDRRMIFLMIINNLRNENRYSHEECYISTISQLFRAIFFYSNFEFETLRENYRKNLEGFFTLFLPSKNRIQISLASLLAENQENVVKWLTENAVLGNNIPSIFDYFPENFSSKNLVWTKENLLQFAFYYYALVGYRFSLFPANELVESVTIDFQTKESICIAVTKLFDDKFQLQKDVKLIITTLQMLFNEQERLPDEDLLRNFNYYNEKLADIKMKICGSIISVISCDAKDINDKLVTLFTNMHPLNPFIYDNTLSLDGGRRLKIRPKFTQIYKDHIAIATDQKLYEIKEFLNSIVLTELPPVTLDFSAKGVIELKSKLTESKYVYRNYSYIDDWAIKKEVRESSDYSDLVELLNSIPFDSRRELQQYIFLKVEKITFNVNVVSYVLSPPTAEQCEKFIQPYKIADGKYRIDDVVRDFNQSVDFLQHYYQIETSELCIVTEITSDSGFRIVFSR